MRGLFITIEGPDGSGKSTQIENIKRFFEDKNIEIVFTREPGGTPIGERIREIILDNSFNEMDPMTEAMLYAASRAQHVAQIIGPALDSGKVVVCDRFVDSSLAYQGYGRNLGEAVDIINSYPLFADIDESARHYPNHIIQKTVAFYKHYHRISTIFYFERINSPYSGGNICTVSTKRRKIVSSHEVCCRLSGSFNVEFPSVMQHEISCKGVL